MTKDGVYRTPKPSKETVKLISKHIISAIKQVQRQLPELSNVFPRFDPEITIPAPYLFFYYSLPLLENVQLVLTPVEENLLSQLTSSIQANRGKEYSDAKTYTDRGMISNKLMEYLIKPGDILVRTKKTPPRAWVATSWATKTGHEPKRSFTDIIERKPVSEDARGPRTWTVKVWSWAFDGSFQKIYDSIDIHLEVKGDHEEVKINSLEYFPLQYDVDGLRATLEKRGRMFWKCRAKKFVSYLEEDHGISSSIGERYMVDIDTYKTLHADSTLAKRKLRAELNKETMARKELPEGDFILLAPSTIIGYNLRLKKWVDLNVDRILDVAWNKDAFESLVVDEKTKELVQALVTNQLKADKSTDLIAGKGNGLTILLHGGPGTGKTFTAEGVAEIAEKPLYRVTCGDVGTKAEDVEKYLESVLNLGKIWDCVVLLDEADVFLEERGLADLERNALVSVFLRVLEYNVGILILTSNRVGTFDEAFQSRIQLALHYKNLTTSQQRKIWRNFLGRLKALDENNIDFEDIIDHMDELTNENMNGRQIRNAITTARQLAQYKEKRFCYDHLKHVIEVSGEFEKYLKELRMGSSDDQIKREVGFR